MDVLTLNGITKYYGRICALNNVSFSVPEGSVFGILGPNGSGKTTMLGIVMDILKASAGTFTFMGQPPTAAMRRRIGTLLETPNFYHYLSAERNLRIAAEIKGKGFEQIDSVLQKVNLYERRASKFSTYSLGMKQRLAIASCLLGDPEVLVFDEPTNGLDPVGIAEIRELIKNLAKEGKTIIMASHMLDEVEKVCTHVAILKFGNLITAGNVDEVLVNEDIVEVGATNMQLLENVLSSMNGYKEIKKQKNYLQLFFETGTANLETINTHCFNNGVVLNHLQLKKKSLETKFLELTNK
ncbi:ATP-binding cassette domain-containing protein [Panacibacter ginsenosidivorans]|uniref:ATP-binding cassette domain-containing protein n=1 Tax=Panacibacter ginsenosidivorans TaxID=1813871 RepID=A0A5B8VC37_9BACT|nr:ATP-binding cassette domain-containing protein [Panacibacter ginsenosidivorans]QEC68839.1 ATP-binding cassette domain-containing protein [Panacibacter ginsenosidivorans]